MNDGKAEQNRSGRLKQENRFMKYAEIVLLSAFSFHVALNAQQSEIQITDRSAHEQRVTVSTHQIDETGKSTVVTNSYVQLQTGLNRWDQNRAQYVEASAEIEIENGHGVIRNAQYQAIFARNANDENGLVDLYLPGGERLVTQPIGLAVTEQETGKSVFLGELRDSEAILLDPHTIIYPDAFDQFKATIVIRSSLNGLESDIILQEKLDAEILRELGIRAEGARLEVWHQVLNKPNAELEASWVKRAEGTFDLDKTVRFKHMAITSGAAFPLNEEGPLKGTETPVAKEWINLEGFDFLIESVPFREAEGTLSSLPERDEARVIDKRKLSEALASVAERRRESTTFETSANDKFAHSSQSTIVRTTKPVSVGSYVSKEQNATSKVRRSSPTALAFQKGGSHESELKRGYLIDFPVTLTTQTNFTFKGDTTYWVTGAIDLYGTTTLEGGTVVKYTNYTSLNPIVTVRGPFKCVTSPYNPAFFTAEDDDTVGEKISSSSGTPLTGTFYAWYNLRFLTSDTNTIQVHDIQSRYSHVGIGFQAPTPAYAWNVSIYNCDRGIETQNSDVYARNVLLNRTRYAFNLNNTANKAFRAEHLTINSAEKLFNDGSGNSSLFITNSLLCTITNSPATGVTSNMTYNVSPSAFTSVGRGNHYLADGTYRNVGTQGVSKEMKSILKQSTTYPPVLLTSHITSETVFAPVVQRDTDVPDLGYHYTPLDYCVSAINSSATVLLTNGAALGVYGPKGFVINSGGKFISEGSPTRMNRLVRYYTVQEDPSSQWGAAPSGGLLELGASAEIRLRFNEICLPSGTVNARTLLSGFENNFRAVTPLAITDCQVRGVYQVFNTYQSGSTFGLTNNVFGRCSLSFGQGFSSLASHTLSIYNNLFDKGSLSLAYYYPDTTWTVKDNFFDSDSLGAGPYSVTASNNGYRSGLSSIGGSGNVTGITPNYVTGALGSFYYPASGGNLSGLTNAGSRNATNAGLYHFTTLIAAGSKETNSVVDIGFHYAALQKVRFVGTDYDTKGDWSAKYGSEGYAILQHATNLPSYATITPSRHGDYTWNGNTTDSRALLKTTSNRIAACIYASSYFDIALTQSDGLPHRIAIYCLDWDPANRLQKIEIKDSITGTVLDTRTVTSFSGGQYYIWDIVGDVTIRCTNLSGGNAVISGLFFDQGVVTVADKDGDGLPDYLEDRNGNGVANAGETDWVATYNSQNGLSGSTGLKTFTPLAN